MNSETKPAEVVLEHVAVERGQVLELHLEGLHGSLEVGETAGLGGQGHRFHRLHVGAGVPGTDVMPCPGTCYST